MAASAQSGPAMRSPSTQVGDFIWCNFFHALLFAFGGGLLGWDASAAQTISPCTRRLWCCPFSLLRLAARGLQSVSHQPTSSCGAVRGEWRVMSVLCGWTPERCRVPFLGVPQPASAHVGMQRVRVRAVSAKTDYDELSTLKV